jgi:transposase
MPQSEKRPVRSRAQTRQIWIERLRRFTDSGVTVVAFCHQEGISSHAFYYWKHKLHPHTPEADQPRLLPVRLKESPSPVELVLPNGCALRLAPGCDLDFVRSLVDALGDDEPC